MPNKAVRTSREIADVIVRIPTAINAPVKAVINLLVCLGLSPKSEMRFFPYLEPTESPNTARTEEPITSEKISSQFVFLRNAVKNFSPLEPQIRTAEKINIQLINALNVRKIIQLKTHSARLHTIYRE